MDVRSSRSRGLLRLDQKGLYRRLERLMKDLRIALEGQGIEAAPALEIFESAAVSIDWNGEAEETPNGRPSMVKGGRE